MSLTVIGLVLNIVGTIIIFFFGISPAINSEGTIRLALEQTSDEESRKYKQ